jgi:fatty acid desaturase
MNYLDLIFILFIHFVADFLFQSRQMGVKKSRNIYWLFAHVYVYSIITFLGWIYFFNLNIKMSFELISLTVFSHFLTDYITSKLSSKFYLKSKKSKSLKESKYFEWLFWSTIGFDQLIHAITLILTFKYIFS